MREIKFRAWEISTRRMILDAHMEYDTITDTRYADAEPDSVVDQPCGTSFGDYLGDDDYIVMQFTGLHDKNGREIYEGDVVTVPIEEITGTRRLTGVIEIKPHATFIDFPNHGASVRIESAMDEWVDDGIEVIGNEHENPELLE